MGHYQYPLIDIVIIVNQTLSYPRTRDTVSVSLSLFLSVSRSTQFRSSPFGSTRSKAKRKTKWSYYFRFTSDVFRTDCIGLSREPSLYYNTTTLTRASRRSLFRVRPACLVTPGTLCIYALSISLPGKPDAVVQSASAEIHQTETENNYVDVACA